MLFYPDIDPVAFHIGPISVHWYGLMYLLGFSCAWAALALRLRHSPNRGFTVPELSDLLFYVAMGVVLGGRLGYMFFYDWYNVVHNPIQIVKIWQGGMSFHGGAIGVAIALWLYSRRFNKHFGDLTDLVSPVIPIGIATGRIGNFINGELWGRVTDVPWAMVFPTVDDLPRHPSQFYEFFLEGILLFIIMWAYSSKPRPRFAVSGLFLLMYGVIRFGIEFFREPDRQMGFLAFGLTTGQLLSLPMIIGGILLITCAYRRSQSCNSI